MRIKILQLKKEHRDKLFLPIEFLKKYTGTEPTLSHYECIYEGEVEEKGNRNETLESTFTLFNVGPKPEGYKGHSLSVSDVVVLQEGNNNSYWFVEPIGFVEIHGENSAINT